MATSGLQRNTIATLLALSSHVATQTSAIWERSAF